MFKGLSRKTLSLMGYDLSPEDSETPVQEAKKQRIDKSNKIQTAYEASFVDDMNKMLRRDRARTQRYEDQKLFGHKIEGATSNSAEEDGMIIADDMRSTHTTINRGGGLIQTLGAMAVGAGTLWAAGQYLDKEQPSKEPPVQDEPVINKDLDYKVDSRVIRPGD